jgi:hypothetical protein
MVVNMRLKERRKEENERIIVNGALKQTRTTFRSAESKVRRCYTSSPESGTRRSIIQVRPKPAILTRIVGK